MKIFCVGRNYADHAGEMKADVPTEPVIFLKPDTALLRRGEDFYYPEFSTDIHYEAEIVYRIGKEGKYIKPSFALQHIDAIGLGIDFTARDLQQQFKAKSLPWELSKAFDRSAGISEMLSISQYPNLKDIHFELFKNGQKAQAGWSGNMIFDIETLIVFISRYITFKTGDLIYTGTPAGVGPIQVGDHLTGTLNGRSILDIKIK